jgi:hypothetical protein
MFKEFVEKFNFYQVDSGCTVETLIEWVKKIINKFRLDHLIQSWNLVQYFPATQQLTQTFKIAFHDGYSINLRIIVTL